MDNKEINSLINLFKQSNQIFLDENKNLILSNVNERTWCGALSQSLRSIISQTEYKNYHVDVEYNKNNGSVKTIINDNYEVVSIICDLIVHSRGESIKKDNLIALEMKKSTSSSIGKEKDKQRLIALTKDSFDNIWANDGKSFPEHVCGYKLGVYYEVNIRNNSILLEYYIKGKFAFKEMIEF